jgi:7-carboxy-7-deazaguanine synthase
MLTVDEIFFSIQGESTHAGQPCVFVRLTGCDLRCSWCDTPYAFSGGRRLSVEAVADEVARYGCGLVEVTGGEPLLQDDVYDLMEMLVARGFNVLLETGGHRSIARVPAEVTIVLDIKCPGSGESGKVEWDNLARLRPQDQVKFVIRDREDYDFARQVTGHHDLAARSAAVLYSPVHGVLDPRVLAGWVLDDRLPVRVQLQIHKYIWGADARGV